MYAVVLRFLAALHKYAGLPAEGLPYIRQAAEMHASGQGGGDIERGLVFEMYEEILRDLGREAEADSIHAMKVELEAAADTVGG